MQNLQRKDLLILGGIALAFLFLNPGITGNAQYNVDSTYGPSKLDSIVKPQDLSKILVVPSIGEKTGTGKIFTEAQVCISDPKYGSDGVIISLSEAERTAIDLAEAACYTGCLRFGGRTGPTFTRNFVETPYKNICKDVKVTCDCKIV